MTSAVTYSRCRAGLGWCARRTTPRDDWGVSSERARGRASVAVQSRYGCWGRLGAGRGSELGASLRWEALLQLLHALDHSLPGGLVEGMTLRSVGRHVMLCSLKFVEIFAVGVPLGRMSQCWTLDGAAPDARAVRGLVACPSSSPRLTNDVSRSSARVGHADPLSTVEV